MPNWELSFKEQLIKNYAHDYRDMELNEIQLAGVLTSFGNELIEKLIEDIPDGLTGQFQGLNRTVATHKLKQQLKAKWLRKEQS
jgi:hypothetical protein